MASVVARLEGRKTKFVIRSASGHEAVVDEPPILGDDEGMRPTEMLLGALAGCTGVNAALLLRKFNQRYSELDVEVEGDQDDSGWPHAFTGMRITFAIRWEEGFEPDPGLVDKALDLACNRYCPVDATLTAGTRISHGRRDL